MFDLGLSSTHTLITGSSGGLGLELCSLFLSQDALVTAHYNCNLAGLDSLPPSSSLVKVQANVEKEEEVKRLFVEAREGMGGKGVEVLVGEFVPGRDERDGIGGKEGKTRAHLSSRLLRSSVNHAYIALNDAPLSKMALEQWNKTIGINLTGQSLPSLRTASSEFVSWADSTRLDFVFPTGTFLLVRAFLNQLQFVPEERKHTIAVVFIG